VSIASELRKEIKLRNAARSRPRREKLVERSREINAEMHWMRERRSKLWSELSDPGLSDRERDDLAEQAASLTRQLNGHAADMRHYDRQGWPSMMTGGSGLSEERRWLVANLQVSVGTHPTQVR
jgi:hypothetical protein